MTDPISDMLTRIRNAYQRRKTDILVPYSNFKHGLAQVLVDSGWLDRLEVRDGVQPKVLVLGLKYDATGAPVITQINRVSRPGQRIYRRNSEIPKVMGGLGTIVVSTSKGVMTDAAARRQKIGGEIICEIW